MLVNKALKLLRNYNQLSQKDLAQHLSISNSYLCEIESGSKPVSLEILGKYSEIFNIPVSSILLFSEQITGEKEVVAKIRFSAAKKIIHLLDWINERADNQIKKQNS